jgi:Ser/Thr protein kinase RdoA (MazF antagonist)
VLRLGVGGESYLLRLDPPVDGFGDPRHWHGCMIIAAEASVAPQVRYANPNGVSIVDFVDQDRDTTYFAADRTTILKNLGGLLSRLHAAPAFPALFNYLDGMNALIGNVRSSGLMSEAELAAPADRFAKVEKAYRRLGPQLVPSHNDVNPRNLVYDGKRLWLVDWTAAFQADRYVDLAAIASFLTRDEESEGVLLEAYFGEPATPAQRARLYIARQTNHVFYAMAMMNRTNGARPARVRSMDDLHLALRDGEPVMDTDIGRAEYALARLAAMVEGVDSPRFSEACQIADRA